MTIGDNGAGFDTDPFAVENATLGLELVKILVDQLDGTIKKMDRPARIISSALSGRRADHLIFFKK